MSYEFLKCKQKIMKRKFSTLGLGFTVIYSVVNTKVVHTCRRDVHVLLEASTELKFIVTITEIYANNTQKEEK